MTPDEFCRWLRGFFELRDTPDQPLTAEQVRRIDAHLRLVYVEVTDPAAGPSKTCEPKPPIPKDLKPTRSSLLDFFEGFDPIQPKKFC